MSGLDGAGNPENAPVEASRGESSETPVKVGISWPPTIGSQTPLIFGFIRQLVDFQTLNLTIPVRLRMDPPILLVF